MIVEKICYENIDYEPVNDRSLFQAISHKSTENRLQARVINTLIAPSQLWILLKT